MNGVLTDGGQHRISSTDYFMLNEVDKGYIDEQQKFIPLNQQKPIYIFWNCDDSECAYCKEKS